MKNVIRVISALGAGASLVWGIARTIKRSRGNTDDGGPDWPPKDAEAAARATPGPQSVKQPAPEKAAEAPPEKPAEVEEPAKEPAAAEPVVVKGVEFANPAAAVAFVNRCDADALDEVGIKGKAQQLVLEVAPIDSVEDLAVPGIGRRTLQSLAGVGRE